uniref:Protein sidekick n=2 Tax=Cacopsylla melanoneura TaxID=428564 RepID=A0A8D9DVI9_9HEMI
MCKVVHLGLVSSKYKMEEKERNVHLFSFSFGLPSHRFSWIPSILLVLFLSSLVQCDNLQAPRFVTHLSAGSIVGEGRTKILQCQALGYPAPLYRWLKDGVELTDFSSEHYYRIVTTRREDQGLYQCIAKNDVGAVLSQGIDLSVAYMGVFDDMTERTVTVDSGQAAILELPYIDSHPTPLVNWQSEDGTTPYDRKYAVTLKHALVILSASPSDQKAYRARATNTQIGKEENSAFVRVVVNDGDPFGEVAPEFVVKPEDLHVKKGAQVSELQCIANARPLHEVVTVWLKDGIPLENTAISYNLNDPWNRTLSLLSANLTHTGKYTCQVHLRSGGFPVIEATANVIVLEPPSFPASGKMETLSEFGATVNIPCEALGVPSPNITWLHNAVNKDKTPHASRYSVEEDDTLIIRNHSSDWNDIRFDEDQLNMSYYLLLSINIK